MADVLRVAGSVPEFAAAFEAVLIENSPVLRAAQQEKLRAAKVPVSWRDHFDGSWSDKPLFLLANEFFDALPIRQYVKTERGWSERMVTAENDETLGFALSPIPVALEIAPARGVANVGAVYEVSPSSRAIVEEIGRVIAGKGGAALLVDYGYDESLGFGETLQAVANHRYKELLAEPGDADLSAHVDFSALARAAQSAGAAAFGPETQGDVLRTLGIAQRMEKLAAKNPDHKDDIETAVMRLIDRDNMGFLFKALAIVPTSAPTPAGFRHGQQDS
jgi:NADH dehydrogenase [ubiquinone] 1 alpha subcomplex assembly factor 7